MNAREDGNRYWRDLGNGYVEFEYPDDPEDDPRTLREPAGMSPMSFAFRTVLTDEAVELLGPIGWLGDWWREQYERLEASLEESLPVGITSTVDLLSPAINRGARAHRVWVDESRSLAGLGVGPDLDVPRWRCLGGEWVPG